MVHFGEAEIFKGEMAQAADSVVGRKFPGANFLEKFADGFGVLG
jgi:hypothetical protein